MTTVVSADFSDNNGEIDMPHVRQHAPGANLVILKLYPGGGWTKRAYDKIKGEVDVVGFYAADSTPSWSQAKAAMASVGIDPHEHPIANDSMEFNVPKMGATAAIAKAKEFIDAAHADGVKVGLYCGRGLVGFYPQVGQDWSWIPDYTGHNPQADLWQYQGLVVSGHSWGDLSRSHLSLDDLRGLATGARGQDQQRHIQPPRFPGRLLRDGVHGDDVKTWQQRMNERIHADPGDPIWLVPDGMFGCKTDRRTRMFQGANKLDVDGVVGPLTWAAAW